MTFGCRGSCKSKIADNQNCLGNNDGNSCVSGQCTCGKCGKKLAVGLACSTNDNCASGWCHGSVTIGCKGYCRAKVADGLRCLSGSDSNSCVSGQCTCGYCGRKMKANYACSTNDNCESGWCDGQITIGCGGKCKRKHDDYESCPLNIVGSGDNNICKSGRCEKISQTEALCAPKNGFKAGTKCNEDTDCDKTKSLWCKGGSFYASGTCTQCPANCPDGCNALFNQNLKCGRMTTFDHAADLAKKIAKPIVDFVECLSPAGSSCIGDIGKGIGACLDPSKPCKIKVGGKGSACLAIVGAGQSYDYSSGPLSLSGSVTPTGGLSVEADISKGQINVELHGKVAVKALAKIETTQAKTIPLTKTKLYLTNCIGKKCSICRNPTSKLQCQPLVLIRKTFVFGYVPVIIEIKVQAVAEYHLKLNAKGSFKASVSYDNDAVLSIKKAIATFDPLKGVKFDVGFEKNFNTQIQKLIVVDADVGLLGVFRVGAEVSFQ